MSTIEQVQHQEQVVQSLENAAFALKDSIAEYRSLTHVKELPGYLSEALYNVQRQLTNEQNKLVRIRAQWKIHNSTE